MEGPKLGIVYALFAAFFAAAFLIPYRLAIASAPRLTAMTCLFVSAAVFNGLLSIRNRPVSVSSWVSVRTAGALAVFTLLGNLGIALALPRIGAGMTSTVMKLQVILTPLMAAYFLSETVASRLYLGGLVALVGLAGPQLAEHQGGEVAGYLAGLLSALSFASMQILTRAVVHRIHAPSVNAIRLVMAVLVLGCFQDGRAAVFASRETWLFGALAGVLGPGLSRLCLMSSLRYMSPSLSALIALVGPVIAFGFGFVFLEELPTQWELLGAVFVLLGVFWVVAPGLRTQRAA